MGDWGNINDYAKPATSGLGQRIVASAEPNIFFRSYADYLRNHVTQNQIATSKGLPSLGSPLSKTAYWNEFKRNMGEMVEYPVRKDVFRTLRSGKVPYSSNYYGPGQKGVEWIDSSTGTRGFTPHTPNSVRVNPSSVRNNVGRNTAVRNRIGTGGIGAAAFGAKSLLTAPVASAFSVAPITSAALIAGAGIIGYGVGRGINKITGGAVDRIAQRAWQPIIDQWYRDRKKPRYNGMYLGQR